MLPKLNTEEKLHPGPRGSAETKKTRILDFLGIEAKGQKQVAQGMCGPEDDIVWPSKK